MKIKYIITSILLSFTFYSCKEADTRTIQQKASSSDYILLDEGQTSLELSSATAGKTAYMVTSSINDEKVDLTSTNSNNLSINQRFLNSLDMNELKNNIIKEQTPNLSSRSTTTYTVGATKYFYYLSYTTDEKDTYTKKKATLKCIGTYCYVWYISDSVTKSDPPDFEEVANTFDTVYELETQIFGSNVPLVNYSNIISISSSDKFNIVMCDIASDCTNEDNYGIYGYYYAADLFKNSYLTSGYTSNENQVLYIDSKLYKNVPDQGRSTIVHEFQHALNFVTKSLNYNLSSSTWYNEMLSMLAEETFQQYLGISDSDSPKGRLPFFNSCSSGGFSSIWGVATSGTYDYANSYAFGTYLLHNYGGLDLLKQIATNNYVNEDSIYRALSSLGYSETFETVVLKFGKLFVNSFYDDDNVATLNKNITPGLSDSETFKELLTEDGYIYTAIDLKDYDYEVSDTKYYYNTDGPHILLSDCYMDNIYPTGFYVNYIGTIPENGVLTGFTSKTITSDNAFSYIYIK